MKGIKDTQATIQNVNFKIDPVVKGSAEAVLSSMGLNMSAYIGMCLRQLAQDRKIPFAQTVDPDFWAAESQVNTAKSLIDRGVWSAVSELRSEVISGFKKAIEAKGAEAYLELLTESYAGKQEDFDHAQAIGDGCLNVKLYFDETSIARFISSSKEALDTINFFRSACKTDAEVKFTEDLEAAYESATREATDKISSFFDSDTGIKDVVENNPLTYDDRDKLAIIEEIESTVLNTAERHPSNLTMRFIGSGQTSALYEVLATVKERKEAGDRLANADKELEKRFEKRK